MDSSGLQAHSSKFWEESEELWPKKIKLDRSNLSVEAKQQLLLQRLYCTDMKSSNKSLCFSEVLWNVNQKGLELQAGNSINLNNTTRPCIYFKLFMNANLQYRQLGNIPFYEKYNLENRDCSIIAEVCSELNEHNLFVTKPESWALHGKEREKSVESGSSWNEFTTVNPIFNDHWAENLITRTESLLVPEFQSNGNGSGCYVHEISRSRAQYQVLKPVTLNDNSNGKISPMCLPVRSSMKRSMADLVFLFYKNQNLNEDGNILSFPKQTRCITNNNFRRKKEFRHLYKPYSRKCERVINPKLVKCAAFELLLQEKKCNCSTANEKNDISLFCQRTVFNIQLKEVSKRRTTKEFNIFSKATVESDTFSIDGNEKQKTARQCVLYNKQNLQNNIHSSTVWDKSLSNAKKTAHLRHLDTLSSGPKMFVKLSIKHSSLPMMVTMVICIQKKIKAFNENSVFPLKKFKTLQFVLQTNKKRITKKFRNSINFVKERKYDHKYLGSCNRALMDKKKYNIKNVQEKCCSSFAANAHLSLLETYEKIPLSDDCDELDQISFISKAFFSYKNNGKYSKACTVSAASIAFNRHDMLAYVLPKLLFTATTNCSYLVVHKSKSKNSQYPNEKNATSQGLKHKINMPLPMNGPVSGNTLSSVIFHDLCTEQNTTLSLKAWHGKLGLFGNRRKQNSCVFDKMKGVLQNQPIFRYGLSNSLKNLKSETIENMKILLQKGISLSSRHGSELVVSVKQNAEDIRQTENITVEKMYTGKRKHNCLILPCSQSESAKMIGSEDRLMELIEDMTEKHLSSEFRNKYEFEMKNQFDLVLKELNVFNNICKENSNSLCEQSNIIQENSHELSYLDSILLEDSKNICENKENVTFSTWGTTLSCTTVVNHNKNKHLLFKDRGLKNSGEQEVPHEDCSSRILDEELFYPTPGGHFDSDGKQPLSWNPAFVSHTFMKERSYSLQGERGNCFNDGVIRVQPLKTCHGPLRVGLSRKAKPKQLHPYLK